MQAVIKILFQLGAALSDISDMLTTFSFNSDPTLSRKFCFL